MIEFFFFTFSSGALPKLVSVDAILGKNANKVTARLDSAIGIQAPPSERIVYVVPERYV